MLVLVARLAFAEEPADTDTGDAADTPEAAPAPPPPPPPAPAPPAARPVFDVVVVKKGAPGGNITPVATTPAAAPPIATTPGASTAPTPPAAVPPPAPEKAGAPVFDVTVVRQVPTTPASAAAPAGPPAPLAPAPQTPVVPAPGGDITPPRAPPDVAIPPPPKEAPAGVPSVSIPPPAPPPPPPLALGVGLRVEGDPAGRWRVYDAADHRYTSVQFARLVADKDMLRRLDNEREFGKIGQAAVGVGGGALLVAGLLVVLGEGGVPNIDDYSVVPADYPSEASYEAAASFEQGQYAKAVASWQSQRLGTTLFLIGSGGVALAAAPFIGRDSEMREERPHLVYRHARAAELVAAYNTAHIPPVVATPTDPSPSKPLDIDDDPPAPSPPSPPADPRVPDRNDGVPDESTFDDFRPPSGIHLRPLLGPAWVGVTGRF